MSEYAKNIQTIEDMFKKRIELRGGVGRMSEYIVELDSKRSVALGLAFAEEMRGGDFVRGEIVRCRDCMWSVDESRWCKRVNEFGGFTWMPIALDGFCAWGEPC